MLERIHLQSFRGFESFDITLNAGRNYLVGPNNAGKSTILNSLRIISAQLRLAKSRAPMSLDDDGGSFWAYPIPLESYPGLDESARFNNGTDEARVDLHWQESVQCAIRWPELEDGESAQPAHFVMHYANGGQPTRPTDVKRNFPEVGVIPTLGPTDGDESLLSEPYVTRNITGRLSSLHFRNHLWLLKETGNLSDFLDFANSWTDEIKLLDIVRTSLTSPKLNLLYTEGPGQDAREIGWAGDGLQVWLQILHHVYRSSDLPTLVLDEPEVFLHPDLQRRLVRVLDETNKQVIVATHSSEMVGEVSNESVLLVDRTRRNVRRIKNSASLGLMSEQLGSSFNLSVAKALKSRVAVFVEGKDSKLLKKSARKLGLADIENERGVAFLPTDGFDGHAHVEAFHYLCTDLLQGSVKSFVILDRDYKTTAELEAVQRTFDRLSIPHKIWSTKEIENQYLDPATIAGICGLTEEDVKAILFDVTSELKTYVLSELTGERIKAAARTKIDPSTIIQETSAEFEAKWPDLSYRLSCTPAKDVLSKLNAALQGRGIKTLLDYSKIADRQSSDRVTSEVRETLEAIDVLLRP